MLLVPGSEMLKKISAIVYSVDKNIRLAILNVKWMCKKSRVYE